MTYAALFVSVPLIVHYLGIETYGALLAMISVATLFASLDFGIGQGLTNLVSEAHGRDDRNAAALFVSSAFYLSVIVVAGLILMMVVMSASEWYGVLDLNTFASERPATVLAIVSACLLVNLPLSLAAFVQIGYQESFWNQGWSSLGAAMGLVAVFAAVRFDAGLEAIVLASFGIPLAASAANTVLLYFHRRPYLVPKIANIRVGSLRTLVTTGLPFFALQVATAIAIWSDEIVVALVFGFATVPNYSIPGRMFNLIPLAVGVIVTPLWPAYREAITRGDRRWVARTLNLSIAVSSVVSVIGAAALLLSHSLVLRWWVGSAIEESPGIALGFAAWAIVVSYSSSLAMFHQGLNRVRVQAVWGVSAALVAVPLKIVLAMELGLPGVIWGRTLAYLTLFAVPLSVQAFAIVRGWTIEGMAAYGQQRSSAGVRGASG